MIHRSALTKRPERSSFHNFYPTRFLPPQYHTPPDPSTPDRHVRGNGSGNQEWKWKMCFVHGAPFLFIDLASLCMHAIAQQPLPPDLPFVVVVGGVRAFVRPGHALCAHTRPRICCAQRFNDTRTDGNAAVDCFATHGMVRSATLTPYHSQPPARTGFHFSLITLYGASCAYTRRPTHSPRTAHPH